MSSSMKRRTVFLMFLTANVKCSAGIVVSIPFASAILDTTSHTSPPSRRSFFANAFVRSFSAANTGRQRSTPRLRRKYFRFSARQRSYRSAGRTSCSVAPSGFFRHPNARGNKDIPLKKPIFSSGCTSTVPVSKTSCEPRTIRSISLDFHLTSFGNGGGSATIQRT